MSNSTAIQSLALAGGGIFDRAAALSAGIPLESVEHEVRIGRVAAVQYGVYRAAGTPPSPDLLLRAALLAAGDDAVLSHRSAARLHDLPGGEADLVELTVPHHRRPRLEGVTVHRTLRMPDQHVRTLDGVRITSVERTLADLGAVVRTATVGQAAETAVVRRMTTVERLFDLVDDHGRQGRSGIGALRCVLEDWLLSERLPDSELEIAFARLVRRFELPPPVFQLAVHDRHGRFVARVDAAWADARLAVEVDGFSCHGTPSAMQHDLTRQNRLVGLGWTVLRFTWHDVVRRPFQVGRQIGDMLTLLGTPAR